MKQENSLTHQERIVIIFGDCVVQLDSSINIQLLMLEYIWSKRGRKIIKQIYDLDKDFLERNFPIGNLPEHNDFIDMEI